MRPLLAILLLAACGTDPVTGPRPADTMTATAGGTIDRVITNRLVADVVEVMVRDAVGEPVAGVSVTFTQNAPAGVIVPEVATTDADGIARATWHLGGVPGNWQAEARNADLGRITFAAKIRTWTASQLVSAAGKSCALDEEGRLACWGGGLFSGRPVPTAVGERFVSLYASNQRGLGNEPICAIATNGRVWCSTVTNLAEWPSGAPGARTSVPFDVIPVDHPPIAKLVAVRGTTQCGLGEDKLIWCWGTNTSGARGDGTIDGPATTVAARIAVPTELRFIDIASGPEHGCALAEDGAPWCWGRNVQGTVKTGETSGTYPTPVRLEVPEPLVSIHANNFEGMCGLTGHGRAVCWGTPYTRGTAIFNDGGSAPAPRHVGWTGLLGSLAPTESGFVGIAAGRVISWGTYDPFHSNTVRLPSEVPGMHPLRFEHLHQVPFDPWVMCGNLAGGMGTVCTSTTLVFARDGRFWSWNPTLREQALHGLQSPVPVDSLGS